MLLTLRETRLAKSGRWFKKGPETVPRTRDEKTLREGARAILCARCGQRITSASARISMGGEHVHVRSNPHGYVWRFGCFDEATGCALAGTPTDEHTWFSGCRWQVAYCSSCELLLGWSFTGAGRFWGLILEHLVEEQPPS